MKYAIPTFETSPCFSTCKMETFLIFTDKYGVTAIECPEHGNINEIGRREFDSMEELQEYLNATDN